jgi:N-acetylmuramoyl-L-alanine amidase
VRRRGALVLALALLPAPAAAQVLRIATGDGAVEVAAGGQRPALYPVAALQHLGASVQADARGARAILFGDTLVFSALSPFFRVRGDVVQLGFPVRHVSGVVHLPEQFFIAWLPARYPERVRYRSGVLRLEPAVVAGPAARPDSSTPGQAVPTPARERRPLQRVVVLDPGHGGRDPGKVGPTGLKEKDAALLLANRVAALLKERGYEVHLTRAKDTLIALADRPRIANRLKGNRAALFISIHANSVVSPKVQGFETFFLSAARTEDERRVAEMENAAIEYEDQPARNGNEIDQILNDMRNDFYVRASSDLAEAVQDRLASFHSGPNRGVKRAGFRVLVGALMPAVLVEVAFISNADEAKLLGTAAFQQKVAWALADAVHGFFDTNEHLWSSGF